MKKYLLLLISVISFNLQSQEKVTDYKMGYLFKSFDINASKPDSENTFDYYIDCYSIDNSISKVLLIIKHAQIDAFIDDLDSCKSVYEKWKKTATENKVTTLNKEIEINRKSYETAFHYGGKFRFDLHSYIKFKFVIRDNSYLLIISSEGKLKSSSNEYIDCDGFMIVFENKDEIDTFINKLNSDLVHSHFNTKDNKEDLFKQ